MSTSSGDSHDLKSPGYETETRKRTKKVSTDFPFLESSLILEESQFIKRITCNLVNITAAF